MSTVNLSVEKLEELVNALPIGQAIWVRLDYSHGTYIFEHRQAGWYERWHEDGKKVEGAHKTSAADVAWTMQASDNWTVEG